MTFQLELKGLQQSCSKPANILGKDPMVESNTSLATPKIRLVVAVVVIPELTSNNEKSEVHRSSLDHAKA